MPEQPLVYTPYVRTLWVLAFLSIGLVHAPDLRAEDELAHWEGRVELPKKTLIRSKEGEKKLRNSHHLTLQWLDGDKKNRGNLAVEETGGRIVLRGQQTHPETGDSIKLVGVVETVDDRALTFVGRIVTKVSYIADGVACTREGRMTFRISGKRKYWRLKENNNPCSEVTDYVDLHFAD